MKLNTFTESNSSSYLSYYCVINLSKCEAQSVTGSGKFMCGNLASYT